MSSSSYQPAFETQPIEPAQPAWKMELNAKLAAHRQRKPSSGYPESSSQAQHERAGDASARASSVAARVAERYAKAPSYSEFLAASAAAATAAAQTAAFAARQAQDAAESFARLSADRDAAGHASWTTREQDASEASEIVGESPLSAPARAPVFDDRRAATVEHPQPLPGRGALPPRPGGSSPSLFGNAGGGIVDAFAEAMVSPAVALPAKLIEFPRELVAPRKSRPRIAEGPLVEAPLFDQAEPSSLRIFEVSGEVGGVADEPGQESGGPGASSSGGPQSSSAGEQTALRGETWGSHIEDARSTYSARPGEARSGSTPDQGAPEWQSIRLGEHPVHPLSDEHVADEGKALTQHQPGRQAQPVLHAASIGDRAMAGLVDASAVMAAFLLFVLVFAACTTHPPIGKTALMCGALVLGGLFLFYQWLFMSFGGGTLGMRYAQVAICTFDDENPTRQTMRRRVGASVLSLLPLGLGFLWALFDEDSLGWHDRMTRSYQRSYR